MITTKESPAQIKINAMSYRKPISRIDRAEKALRDAHALLLDARERHAWAVRLGEDGDSTWRDVEFAQQALDMAAWSVDRARRAMA